MGLFFMQSLIIGISVISARDFTENRCIFRSRYLNLPFRYVSLPLRTESTRTGQQFIQKNPVSQQEGFAKTGPPT
jgi:hypothetical protein